MTSQGPVQLASLETPRRKLARSREDLDKLDAAISKFLDKNPYRIATRQERKTGDTLAFMRVTTPPNQEWSLDIFPIANQIRSALDTLIYQLVIASGNDPRKGHTQFPIYVSPDDYWQAKGMSPSKRDQNLRGVDERFRAVIDSLQPYQRGTLAKSDPLAVLAWLTNTDKHNDMHAALFALEACEAHIAPNRELPNGQVLQFSYAAPWEVKDGTQLWRFQFRKFDLKPKVNMEAAGVDVGFGTLPVTRARLLGIHEYVSNIVTRFVQALE